MASKVPETENFRKFKQQQLLKKFIHNRQKTADSIIDFPMNKKRLRVLSKSKTLARNAAGILYWMFRDCRVQDNWAFLYAQELALKNRLPLHVCYCTHSECARTSLRHFKFLVRALKLVYNECQELNISFHLLYGEPVSAVLDFIHNYKMGALFIDFSPLRLPMSWVEQIREKLPKNIPFCQVDAHNIVPCWRASDKLEQSWQTIGPKITSQLSEYLTEFPPVVKHPYDSTYQFPNLNWNHFRDFIVIDDTVEMLHWCRPGYPGAVGELERFLRMGLQDYHEKRNDPMKKATSRLSPWFHFGLISPARVMLEVQEYMKDHPESVKSFIAEAVIRRELSDNFCFYNENYDKLKGAPYWAIKSLKAHRKDNRKWLYTLEEFENSQTHDDLWNAAHNQLLRKGKMHGFMRKYWAKKILEWSPTPEDALAWAIYLNDKYSLDGRDPNGYVGCMWSICGVHDRRFMEREVTGTIRYMDYKECEETFDVNAYMKKFNRKIVNKKEPVEENPKKLKK
ncbi:deoxyribodipyrimidine photo-lyase-like [Diachasmimorpha longicaudata]|uniref:deoxyribodipyrimidine photo-lyase-like n=1 Tax=Diachasmimorpha longicaudata TaxID=58733 RepID=UPI0030B8AE6B